MRFFVDSHPDGLLHHPCDQLYGWVERPVGSDISFHVDNVRLAAAVYPRQDLDPAAAVGFTAYLDHAELWRRGLFRERLEIGIYENGSPIGALPFDVVEFGVKDLARIDDKRRMRRNFIKEHWRGPTQRGDTVAFNALPPSWTLKPNIDGNPDLVCRHHYDGMIHDFIRGLGPDAMIIEIGSGLRFNPAPNVVTVEIYDYPSTDVLAVAEELPFPDATFDGALALNVLEHVRNPFVCARELRRVIKPGGKLYIMIPFQAPEHGYPSHYFNATRFGVRELFKGCGIDSQIVHPSSHPIGALNNALSVYLEGLAPDTREVFRKMTIAEIMSLSHTSMHEVVTTLDPEQAFKIAWGTTTIFTNA